ncbi:MAG: BMP family ABC transporter substrate-binding protein [Pelolinea sp.]|nr:BMP family ABC transporter substrate-binding protein [Pelolinea sp.]
MKNNRFTIIGLLVIGTMLIAACGGAAAPAKEAAPAEAAPAEAAPAEAAPAAEPMKVVHLVNGTLGDKSFTDSAHRGLVDAAKDFGFELVTIEAGNDPAKWEPAFMDTVQDPTTDFVVIGSGDLMDVLVRTAPEYPDIKFIMFDNPVDFKACGEGCNNIYAVQYKQNEGSYLAGLYAGLMSESKIIGAVGGMDIPVINDFFAGYYQGAEEAGVKKENVLIQFAGSWNDPAKGKELALTMYQQGADVVFQVAGGTGEGVFYAAQEAGKWAIGVDSDQALIIEETNADQAARILTSMLKNVDKSLYRAFKLYSEGKLPFGTNENLGIPFGVGLAYNKYFDKNTPQEVKDKIAAAEAKVISGETKVATVF